MTDIDRLIQDLKVDYGYALNRQRAIEAAAILQEFSSKIQLLTDYRDLLRTEGGNWKADLVANDLSSVLDNQSWFELPRPLQL